VIRRILVPLDGSPLAERALLVAGDLAESLAATLVVARVVAVRPEGRQYRANLIDELTDAESREAESYLASVAKRLRHDRLSVETILLHGEPAPALASTAQDEHCDVLVLTSHGTSGLASHVFGSVAQKLLYSAPCPVLVVRCTAKDIEDEEEREEQASDRVLVEQLGAGGGSGDE
jgi:nucleotide-binding universal stress UspA family protein